jgi:hypothetical protein
VAALAKLWCVRGQGLSARAAGRPASSGWPFRALIYTLDLRDNSVSNTWSATKTICTIPHFSNSARSHSATRSRFLQYFRILVGPLRRASILRQTNHTCGRVSASTTAIAACGQQHHAKGGAIASSRYIAAHDIVGALFSAPGKLSRRVRVPSAISRR